MAIGALAIGLAFGYTQNTAFGPRALEQTLVYDAGIAFLITFNQYYATLPTTTTLSFPVASDIDATQTLNKLQCQIPVSYTHLTLPTKRIV